MNHKTSNNSARFRFTLFLTIVAFGISAAPSVQAQGMPAAARENIHALFSQHTNVTRKVTMTQNGYVAVTESADPKLAKILREHVSQMRERYKSGRMVRGWDPAFQELREYYDDISHRVEATDKGLKITVRGKTPAAIKVAQGHAGIVSGFAAHGWDNHDKRHPRFADAPAKVDAAAKGDAKAGKGACCSEKTCCLAGGKKADDPLAQLPGAGDLKKAGHSKQGCEKCQSSVGSKK